jgi:hypothetical protein
MRTQFEPEGFSGRPRFQGASRSLSRLAWRRCISCGEKGRLSWSRRRDVRGGLGGHKVRVSLAE